MGVKHKLCYNDSKLKYSKMFSGISLSILYWKEKEAIVVNKIEFPNLWTFIIYQISCVTRKTFYEITNPSITWFHSRKWIDMKLYNVAHMMQFWILDKGIVRKVAIAQM